MVNLNNRFKAEYGVYIYALAIALLIAGQLVVAIILQAAKPYLSGDVVEVGGESVYKAEYVLKYGLSFIFQLTNLAAVFIIMLKTKSKPDLFIAFKPQDDIDSGDTTVFPQSFADVSVQGGRKACPRGDTDNRDILQNPSKKALASQTAYAKKSNKKALASQTSYAKKSKVGIIIWCVCGVLMGLICLFCFMCLAEAGQRLLINIGYPTTDYVQGIVAQDVLLLILSVFIAPVCEELVYRSGLLSGLKRQNYDKQARQYKNNQYNNAPYINSQNNKNPKDIIQNNINKTAVKAAVKKQLNSIKISILVGLAFALMHMNPEQTIYQFFLGFAASMLTLSCGSVLPAIIMHATSNLVAALSMIGIDGVTAFFDWYLRIFIESSPVIFAVCAIIFALIGIAFFIFLPLFVSRLINKNKIIKAQKAKSDSGKNDSPIAQGFIDKHKITLLYLSVLAVTALMWIFIFFMS